MSYNLSNWMTLNQESSYFKYYDNLRNEVAGIHPSRFYDDYFTPHDASHCRSIEKIIDILLSNCDLNHFQLSDLEKFLLLSSIWSHDLGMISDIANDYFILYKKQQQFNAAKKRELHDLISAWYLSNNYKLIFLENNNINIDPLLDSELRSYVDTINIIIKYHRRKTNIKDCPEYKNVGKERIRCRLLASLLRLGDTLHIDSSRFDERSYNIIQLGEFDRFARLHWLKSYIVSAPPRLDKDNQVVTISIDLPEISSFNIKIDENKCKSCEPCLIECPRNIIIIENNKPITLNTAKCKNCKICEIKCSHGAVSVKENNLEENLENLKFFISHDIQEDILAVADTFRKFHLPIYLTVDFEINRIPGFDEKRGNEILGVLNDLDLIFSPNSTRAIKKALESLASFAEMEFRNQKECTSQLSELSRNLKSLCERRPCHIGLKKISDDVETINNSRGIADIKSALKHMVAEIEKTRKNSWDKIFGDVYFRILSGKKNIFLYAYSEMAITYLKEYAKKHNEFYMANIYIFEGAPKRRLLPGNVFEYIDGYYYATQLSRVGFSCIKLLPDVAFASLLNIEKCKDHEDTNYCQNSILLFGANGFDDEYFGHTSGHLALAIIAAHFKIPIAVIADSYKKGSIDWNISKTRETDWLTTQKNIRDDMEDRGIKMVNFLEDQVPHEIMGQRIILITD